MKKELEEVLSEVIKKGLELAEKTGDFVISEAPELIEQFLTWKLYENVLFSSGLLFTIIGILFVTYRFYKHLKNDIDDEASYLAFLIGFIISIISLVVFIYRLNNIVQIIVAPKLYLIEYFIK